MSGLTLPRIDFDDVLDCRYVLSSGAVELEFGSTNPAEETKWFKSDGLNMLSSGSKAITTYFLDLSEEDLNVFEGATDSAIIKLVAICRERLEQKEQMYDLAANAVSRARARRDADA